ncbi:putative RDD family membrane protein YckC [Chryseobacterium sp. 7]|uniref:RDD family protein n=1 Tax=Chryseobacterium sp. 7 TaxID=2035214 RepID=UPI000EB44B4D|nr:RDD family protein [Chryseobacterium sp. 7]RLJ33960.1 putative RDD family membrane protein YckC [Chryseobacterium sp. 7]
MKRILNVVEYNKASSGIRLANNFLDLIVLYIVNYILSSVSNLLYEATSIEFFYFYSNGNLLWQILIGNFNYCLYYFLMENYLDGRTVAKYITGTKVISTDGTKPTTQQIVYRTLSRIVPFDGLSFLGVNGWHDTWSDTRVINIKNYQAEIQAKSEIEDLGKKEIA